MGRLSADYDLVLPWPPSVNDWKTPFKNRMILTAKGRAYRAAVDRELTRIGLHSEMIDSDLAVSIELHPPSLRKYDVDNFTKSLFDALTSAKFWLDDSQVQKMTVQKVEKIKGGAVKIKIHKIN